MLLLLCYMGKWEFQIPFFMPSLFIFHSIYKYYINSWCKKLQQFFGKFYYVISHGFDPLYIFIFFGLSFLFHICCTFHNILFCLSKMLYFCQSLHGWMCTYKWDNLSCNWYFVLPWFHSTPNHIVLIER